MLLAYFLLSSLLQNQECPQWTAVHRQYGERYQNILPVFDLIQILSPSSAVAERGFSQLKLIKTNLRTKLNHSTLNNCLAIK
jgi:hypothetical protein